MSARTVAGNLIGAKILLLGSESPVDDPPREIEILNQIIQDPTIDGLIMTTPQVGAYNDIVKKLPRRRAFRSPRPIRSTARIYDRDGISHTGQERLGGGDRRRRHWPSACSTRASTRARSSSRRRRPRATSRSTIASPPPSTRPSRRSRTPASSTTSRSTPAPRMIGIDRSTTRTSPARSSPVSNRAATWSASSGRTASSRRRSSRRSPRPRMDRQDLHLRLRPRARSSSTASSRGALTGSLGQQPFLQGFWPVMQLYLQIDRGISAANLDTRAQLVTKDTVGNGRQALRELASPIWSGRIAAGPPLSRDCSVSTRRNRSTAWRR